jgi:pyruvate,water dikinase
MAKKWIMWLEEFGKESVALVGAKNANMGEMIRMGLAIPPGFAITTEAYDEFVTKKRVKLEIEQYLAKFPQGPQSPAHYREISQFASDVFLSKELLQEIQEAIVSAYDELSRKCETSDVPVVVRSSGIAEDLPTASFAGQYDSYLHVRGKDMLLDKVKGCWASLFTARSIFYRIKNNLPILATSMSVGVQKMVDVRAAGVGFSVHPATGNDTQILLEGNWGTGESVVQGLVIPDRFVINKETLRLEEKEISRKLKQIVAGQAGTEEQEIPEDKQSLPCLTDEEAVKIAEFTKAVEKSYGIPMDIEWAIDQALPFPKNIFLVQARPVTQLGEKKDTIDKVLDILSGHR